MYNMGQSRILLQADNKYSNILYFTEMSYFALAMSVLLALSNESINFSHFIQTTASHVCNMTARIDLGCSKEVVKFRSRVHCGVYCGFDSSCIGVSVGETETCFLHRLCPAIPECTMENITYHNLLMKSVCVHGTWDWATQSCLCHKGYHGESCTKRYARCKDLITAGYTQGLHELILDPDQDGLNTFPVFCRVHNDMTASVKLMKNAGEIDLNYTWVDYVDGFFYDDQHMWTGLHAWHKLSHAGCDKLNFEFTLKTLPDAPFLRRRYYGFRVSGPETNYAFTFDRTNNVSRVGFPSGSYFGDCLGHLQGVPFSTSDNDNDGNPLENCAQKAGSGWWFDGCDNPCNAFGYGLPLWDDKPRQQLFSLIGLDMELVASEMGYFYMYLHCN